MFTTEDERDSKTWNKVENLSTSPELGSSASHGTLNQSMVEPRFPLSKLKRWTLQ
jgi:hypothetical protein